MQKISSKGPQDKRRNKKKRYTDEQVFKLWQEGKSDAKIGEIVGVSHTMIQRWRERMGLPSNKRLSTDTAKYKLVDTPLGKFAVTEDDMAPSNS